MTHMSTGNAFQKVKEINRMSYFIKGDTLFLSNTPDEDKETLATSLADTATSSIELTSVPGALHKTLHQSTDGFFFENEGPYSFAVVGREKKEHGQLHIVLSNDESYLRLLLNDPSN